MPEFIMWSVALAVPIIVVKQRRWTFPLSITLWAMGCVNMLYALYLISINTHGGLLIFSVTVFFAFFYYSIYWKVVAVFTIIAFLLYIVY